MRSNFRRQKTNRSLHGNRPAALHYEPLEDRRLLATYGSGPIDVLFSDLDTVSPAIEVGNALTVDDINVTLNISHTNAADLDVFLRAPDGTTIELFTDVGGGGNHFSGTTLDDEASTPITSGSAPFSGSYQPEQSLSGFDNADGQGMWTLFVTDDKNKGPSSGGGMLNSWSIDVTPQGPILPSISIDDVQLVEGDSGTSAFVFTVSRTGDDLSNSSTVEYATADGTATAGSDYSAGSGQVFFDVEQTEQTIIVTVNGDTTIEPTETFTVDLFNPANATITDHQGVGTIVDDDLTPTISFHDFSDPSGLNLVGEAVISADNRLRLTPAVGGTNGAAWYDAEKQFVSFAWETTFDFNLNETSNHASGGGSDGFVFAIQNHDPGFLAGGGGTLGYNNLPNSIVVEFDTYRNSEPGDPDHSHISVHTNGIGPNGWDESLSLGLYSTPDIMDDNATHSVKISYTPGTMRVFFDDAANPVITASVDLADILDLDVGRAWVGFTAATGGGWQNHDILNWDYSVLVDTTTTIGIDDVSVIEGDSGATDMVFTVHRLGETSETTTADWTTADGTAFAGSDYVTDSGQVFFDVGQTQQTITVTVNGDAVEEAHETLFVSLSNSVGAIIVDGNATGTILNDEATISIDDVTVIEGNRVFKFVDQFVPPDGGGLSASRDLLIGQDGNVYVASRDSDDVKVFDGTTAELLRTLEAPELDDPWSLAFDSNGFLFVGGMASDNVVRFDPVTGSSVEFIVSGTQGLHHPKGLTFGPDGDIYVSANDGMHDVPMDRILRFDGQTGAFIDEFVNPTKGNGGLDNPNGMTLGPDGNLYVASTRSDNVLRFNSSTGEFIDEFIAPLTAGMDAPTRLVFHTDGYLYVAAQANNETMRFDPQTAEFVEVIASDSGGFAFNTDGHLYISVGVPTGVPGSHIDRYVTGDHATFNVSLSSESGETVTVEYASADGSATIIDGDYVATSGMLVFDPGVTTRTIVVQTLEDGVTEPDETFFMNLSSPSSGATISDSLGIATIIDQPLTLIETNSLSQSISDRSTITSTINVGLDFNISDLNVEVNIGHSRDKDLDVFLISPGGTRINLFTDVGGNGDDFVGTILDDDAATSITAGAAPFAGSFRPEGDLSAINGISTQGMWILEVTDDQNQFSGTLNSWTLEFTLGSSLTAAVVSDGAGVQLLNVADVRTMVSRAEQLWGPIDHDSRIASYEIQVADLPGNLLGLTRDHTITIDIDAAGMGWFIDATPREGSGFVGFGPVTGKRYDLLTVLAHELGHLLGHEHADHGVMSSVLKPGERLLPGRNHEHSISAGYIFDRGISSASEFASTNHHRVEAGTAPMLQSPQAFVTNLSTSANEIHSYVQSNNGLRDRWFADDAMILDDLADEHEIFETVFGEWDELQLFPD